MFPGFTIAAQDSGRLRARDFKLYFPLLPNIRGYLPGNQVVRVNLNVEIFEACLARQPKKLSPDERVKTGSAEGCYDFFYGALQCRIFRVMPQKLPIQVLQQNSSAWPAHSDQFSNRTLLLLEVLKQHAAIDEVETLRRELHRLCIAAYEPRSRIVPISANRFRNAIWTDIYAGSP